MVKPWDKLRANIQPGTWQGAGPKIEFVGFLPYSGITLRIGSETNDSVYFDRKGLREAAEFFNELADQHERSEAEA